MSARHAAPRTRSRVRRVFGAASASILAVTGITWATMSPAHAVPTFNPFDSGSSATQPLRPAPRVIEPKFEAPVLKCTEDMPCWRVWHGNGTWGPNAPAYMFLPESVTDPVILAMFGYQAD